MLECIEWYLVYWSKATLTELVVDRETVSSSCNCAQIKYWQFQVIVVTASLVATASAA
jgi:hypothetical protein